MWHFVINLQTQTMIFKIPHICKCKDDKFLGMSNLLFSFSLGTRESVLATIGIIQRIKNIYLVNKVDLGFWSHRLP